jgi:hypothetical protein
MDVADLVKLVKDVGFPIGLAIYLLVRFDRMVTKVIENSTRELEILCQLRDNQVYLGRPHQERQHSEKN